jgi:hypothetical protein
VITAIDTVSILKWVLVGLGAVGSFMLVAGIALFVNAKKQNLSTTKEQ